MINTQDSQQTLKLPTKPLDIANNNNPTNIISKHSLMLRWQSPPNKLHIVKKIASNSAAPI